MPVFGQTTANDWILQGYAFDIKENYNEAINAYDNAIDLDPTNAEAWT
jgi:cytochrome c-type biogenesis protein CcmH/NrfG